MRCDADQLRRRWAHVSFTGLNIARKWQVGRSAGKQVGMNKRGTGSANQEEWMGLGGGVAHGLWSAHGLVNTQVRGPLTDGWRMGQGCSTWAASTHGDEPNPNLPRNRRPEDT